MKEQEIACASIWDYQLTDKELKERLTYTERKRPESYDNYFHDYNVVGGGANEQIFPKLP